MRDFVIMTDSSCDLPAETAKQWGIDVIPLSLQIDDKIYINHLDERDISFLDFYKILRSGKTGKTSSPNLSDFIYHMEEIVKGGKDILYLGFSSGLSGTYNVGAIAANEVAAKYPECHIYAIDTLCASLGQGLLIYYAVQEKNKGRSLEEVRDFVERTKLNVCHWFTVDDLNFLCKGGRISSATAIAGTILNIKPVMHMDNEGHLINVGKARGRKKAIKHLVKHMEELVLPGNVDTVFISHGDCREDAEYLAEMLCENWDIRNVIINFVGPVIGAHSGPGTLALFFMGKER